MILTIFSHLQNRTIASIRAKWHNDKSNIRDYVQYLMTSQSRSGRNPDAIPKIRYMNLMIEVMGLQCPGINLPPGKLKHFFLYKT